MTDRATPLKILIVEDEAIQRQALAAMCHKVMSPSVVETEEASDGAKALARAREWHPDIVLLDIRMPNLDGLRTAGRLGSSRRDITATPGARSPMPQIIFVTAYDDFTYARQALTLGAADYLLKPVSSDELRRALTKAGERVAAADRIAARAERTARRLKAAMPLLRIEAFRDLLDGTLVCPSRSRDHGPVLDERLSLAGITRQPTLAMFFHLGEAAAGEPAGRATTITEAAVTEQDVSSAFTRVLRRRLGAAWLTGPSGPGRLGVFLEPPLQGDDAVRDWALALAAALKAEGERITGRPVSAGVGDHHPEDGGLVVSAREGLMALGLRAQLGPGCLVHVADTRPQARTDPFATGLPPLGPLLDSIRLGQADRATAQAGKLAEDIAVTGPEGLGGVLAAELIALSGRAAIEGGADPAPARRLQGRSLRWVAEAVAGARPAGEMVQAVTGFVRELAGLVRTAQASRQGGVVKRAVAYIRANFQRGITLEEVAREVHVSHYYLSHLLRRESGRSFTDHLTGSRVGLARELLASTDLGINEIADRAGFADGNYFSRVFKRETGMTPSVYRRQARSTG